MPLQVFSTGLTLRQAAVFYCVIWLLALGLSWPTQAGGALVWRLPRGDLPISLIAGALSGLALVLCTMAAEKLWPAMRKLAVELSGLIGDTSWPRALTLALLSGVAEEALFRGPIQAVLGIWLTAFLFALLHGGGKRRYLAWTAFALVGGCVFGLLGRHFQSIWPAAVAHIVVNAINLRRLAAYAPNQPQKAFP